MKRDGAGLQTLPFHPEFLLFAAALHCSEDDAFLKFLHINNACAEVKRVSARSVVAIRNILLV